MTVEAPSRTAGAPPERPTEIELWVWRHPRPIGAAGRCIGRTDLPVDPRRTRRLARRIATIIRDADLPREVWTSPSTRCADVGRLLARRGFTHRIDTRLAELDFGAWDGQCWSAIAADEVARWETDFEHHRPGDGESVASLTRRARSFLVERAARSATPDQIAGSPAEKPATSLAAATAVLVVGHAGWINAVRMLGQSPGATHWPAPLDYGSLLRFDIAAHAAYARAR